MQGLDRWRQGGRQLVILPRRPAEAAAGLAQPRAPGARPARTVDRQEPDLPGDGVPHLRAERDRVARVGFLAREERPEVISIRTT